MGLDLLFVAVFHWGVAGAAVATVLTQGISFLLCLRRMCRVKDDTRLDLRRLGFSPASSPRCLPRVCRPASKTL